MAKKRNGEAMANLSRRSLLKRTAAGAAAVWTAPVVTRVTLEPAAALSGGCEKWQITQQRPLANQGWANQPVTGMNCTDKVCSWLTAFTGNTPQMIGLNSDPNFNASWNSIDYAMYWYIRDGLVRIYIYESASYKFYLGTVSIGDEVCVVRNPATGVVTYQVNGTVLYTSATTSLDDLYVDTSFYSTNTGFWSTGSSSFDISTC